MRANAFSGMTEVKRAINHQFETEDREGRHFFGFDPENELLMRIECQDDEPLPGQFSGGYLYRVDFDETGDSYEVTMLV